jgi:hypothetical protein
MATVNLHPSSTVSNQWTINGGDGTVHGVLSDSNDASSIRDNAQNQTAIVQLDDFTAGGTITSIRHYIRGYKHNARSGDVEVQVIIENSSGTALYSENHQLLFNDYNAQDFNGTARTTSDGSSAWTTTDLNGLRLNINTSPEDPPGFSFANVVKAYIEVTYTSGYGNNVMGVDSGDIASINGVATADISKVNGV